MLRYEHLELLSDIVHEFGKSSEYPAHAIDVRVLHSPAITGRLIQGRPRLWEIYLAGLIDNEKA